MSSVKIMLYNEMYKNNLIDQGNFTSFDEHFANYFWHECAKKWHDEYIHKVYVSISEEDNQILGFFSIRANEITIEGENEKEFIPIADISFMDVNRKLDDQSSKLIFNAFLEHIELNICQELIKWIGCRYIRVYLPSRPQKIQGGADVAGESLLPYLEDLFNEMNYFEPPVKETSKIRRINKNNETLLVLKYFLRDLLPED